MAGWFGRLRRRDDRGASLVEFALVAPLLLLLVFGIIEASWAFNAQLDLRHGARELARLAAVNGDTTANMVGTACGVMDNNSDTYMALWQVDRVDTAATNEIGDGAVVHVMREYGGLTGFLAAFGSIRMHSEVEIRLEQEGSWAPAQPADVDDPTDGAYASC